MSALIIIHSESAKPFFSSSFLNLLESCPCLSGIEVCVINGVDGFGGDEPGVLNIVVVVIFSKKASNCFSDNALCNVSRGRIGGTAPNPSRTENYFICFSFINLSKY